MVSHVMSLLPESTIGISYPDGWEAFCQTAGLSFWNSGSA